jgi:PIN domain nuclease of toxin-antitoxin system
VRYLLDTQVWLWMQAQPERIGPAALTEISNERNSLFLSAASSWEIAAKVRVGRLHLPQIPPIYVPDRMRVSDVEGLAVEHQYALDAVMLDDHHRDPFDRMIIAQSMTERMPVITADVTFGRYDVEVLEARR